jgi:hypothetical protein
MPTRAPYPVTGTQLVYVQGQPQFEVLALQHLANFATGTDGFDVAMNGVAAALDKETPVGPALDQHLAAMDFREGAFDAARISPIVRDTDTFTRAGDKLVTQYGKDVKGNPAGATGLPPLPKSCNIFEILAGKCNESQQGAQTTQPAPPAASGSGGESGGSGGGITVGGTVQPGAGGAKLPPGFRKPL